MFPQTSNFRIKEALLYVFEDNEALIKMIIKGRDMFPGPTELRLNGYSIESIWTTKSKSNTSTPKTNLPTFEPKEISHVTKGIICCVCSILAISVLQFCSVAMAKRVQQDSGEERVTAKSRPTMSLIARAPSNPSSSASESPVKRSYGNQDPWNANAEKEDRMGQPVVGSDRRTVPGNCHEQFAESSFSARYSKWDDNKAWSSHEWRAD